MLSKGGGERNIEKTNFTCGEGGKGGKNSHEWRGTEIGNEFMG